MLGFLLSFRKRKQKGLVRRCGEDGDVILFTKEKEKLNKEEIVGFGVEF